MTVEFMVVFPVLIIVAVLTVNILLFFSECAAFDRVAREAIRVHASSPSYGQSPEQSCAQAEQEIKKRFEKEYLSCSLAMSRDSLGHTTFTATLTFSPTLFGMGMRSEVLGVSMPQFNHSATMSLDSYKPGVLL